MADFKDRNDCPETPNTDETPTATFLLQTLAVLLIAAVAFTANYTQVWNPDVLWQLASGQWMAENHQILETSTFSTDAVTPWINVHWLFQLGVAGLHSLGGFAVLTLLKAGLAGATMLILGLALRKHAPPAWLIITGLLAGVVMSFRIRVRPEAVTFLLLMLALTITEIARRDSKKAKLLYFLLPIQLLWVNTHGLFILGPVVYISAVAGDYLDARRKKSSGNLLHKTALLPMAIAMLMCFISPWPIRTVLLPLKLLGEIFTLGQAAGYSQNISELLPIWSEPLSNPLAVVLVAGTLIAMLLNFRRVPSCHWLWFVAFVPLALLARRNVGLLGPVLGLLLGIHGGALILRLKNYRYFNSKGLAGSATAVVFILAGFAFLGYSRGWFPAWLGNDGGIPGPGLQRHRYALDAAEFLQTGGAEGNVFCENFGDAGAFIYCSGPRNAITRRVFMDGRLEAHTPERFTRQQELQKRLASPISASSVDLPEDIRFIFIGRRSGGALIAAMQSPRFVFLLAEPAGALFARRDWPGGLDRLDTQAGFRKIDRPLLPDNTLGPPAGQKNATKVNLDLAEVLLQLGLYDPQAVPNQANKRCCMLAVRYMTAAGTAGLLPKKLSKPMLGQTWLQWSLQDARAETSELPFDLNLARTLYIFNQCKLEDASNAQTRQFAAQKIQAYYMSGQLNQADTLIKNVLQKIDGPVPVNIELLQNTISASLIKNEQLILKFGLADRKKFSNLDRARAFSSPLMQLTGRAINLLYEDANLSQQGWILLGDLLLRTGRVEEAKLAYNRLAEIRPKWNKGLQHRLRLALCDWVEGKYYPAVEELRKLCDTYKTGTDSLAGRYYLGSFQILLGLYKQSAETLAECKTGELSNEAAIQFYQLKRQADTLASQIANRDKR